MNRLGTVLLVGALVSALMAVPLGAAAAVADHNETTGVDTVRPGERLAGVVGVQGAEVDGDLSERRYDVRLSNAETDQQRADIVAERREELQQRLSDHQAELAELRAAREAGNISEGAYRARVATVAAEKTTTERAAGRASETARQLPEGALEARGVSVESLEALRTNASELGGPETAEIAREIGGPNVGTPAAGDRTSGPPERAVDNRAGNQSLSDRAENQSHAGGPPEGQDTVRATGTTPDRAGGPDQPERSTTPESTASSDGGADQQNGATDRNRQQNGAIDRSGPQNEPSNNAESRNTTDFSGN